MSKKVMSEISIQHAHPILYNDYNICELVKNSKLSNFSIKVLNDIVLLSDSIIPRSTLRGRSRLSIF